MKQYSKPEINVEIIEIDEILMGSPATETFGGETEPGTGIGIFDERWNKIY